MNGEGRFFRWASRILALVCLVLLVLNLLKPSGEEKSPPVSEPAVADPSPPVAVLGARTDRRVGERRSPPTARNRKERADTRVRPYNTPPAPPPEPAVTTLKPLGYVERADGTVEAVVADGPFVAVLREGELFRGEYRVAKVTPTLVEIQKQPAPAAPKVVDLAAPPGPEREVAAIQRPASESASPAAVQPETRPEPQGEPASSPSEGIPISKLLDNKGQRLREPEPLPAPAESRGDARGPELGRSAGPRPTRAPVPTPGPRQSPPEPARPLKPMGYVEWASGRLQAVVEDQGEVYLVSEGEVFADRYRALRVTESSVEVVEGLSPPARASPMELAARQALQRSTAQPLIEVAHSPPPRKPAEKSGGASQESVDSALAASIPGRSVPESPPTAPLPTLGYVQEQSGELEAILADGDEVRLVRPGDVVAGKYLALSVSRSSVEVGSVADGGLPNSAGAVAEDGGGGAAVALAAGSRPVATKALEKAALREEVKTAAGQPAVPALEPAGAERMTAASVTPLGYVEMAAGRVEMIVAGGDRVDLVHDGFEWGEERQAVRQLQVASSHSPPQAEPEAASPQEEGHEASETGPGPAYLVTHVHSPRFDFDLHVRLPDNRSD